MSTSTQVETRRVTVNCPGCQTVNPDADVNAKCSECGGLLGVAVVQHSVVGLGSMNSSWVNRTLGGPLSALAMFASVAWGAYIIFFRIQNDSKAYKPKSA